MFEFPAIAEITDGKIVSANHSGTINHFLTDSRRLVNPRGSAFVAIRGQRHDGHHYLKSLFRHGVRNFIIEYEDDLEDIPGTSNILLVEDAILALQKIATFHRKGFQIPVVGITGSNGKTIVKEWLGQLLGKNYKVIKSPNSYNSQLGVPLSVLQMNSWNSLAVFEAGISTVGEMQKLQKVIQPTLGVYTNIGSAHDQGFKDRNEKSLEKWRLFTSCKAVVYCQDHQTVHLNKPEQTNGFTWGVGQGANLKIMSTNKHSSYSILNLQYQDSVFSIKVPFNDDVSLENVMHCISVMVYLNVAVDEIAEALLRLSNIEHRLSLKKGINNCYLVDDSYNNDLAGLQIALDFLKNQPGKKRKVILSDILQSGLEDGVLFAQLDQLLLSNQIDALVGIGEGMLNNSSVFQLPAELYKTTDQFLNEASTDQFHDENILIKGARPFEFEKITNLLSEKIHGTVLEINLDALNDNLNYYRSKLQDGVKLMVMVKASAYGSGSHEIARLLQHNRVDYLAVAYPDEGVELRKHGIHMPMMVMNVAPESYHNILKYDLEPEVYGLGQLRSLIKFLEDENTQLPIHLKLDTGMHRLGFEDKDLKELIALLKTTPSMEIVSIYSHLAGADEETHNAFSKSQFVAFTEMAQVLERSLNIRPIKHILNSAGMIRFPEYQLDMVRLGIGLYGFEATRQEQGQLRPISTLKTVISQMREVKKGETIGYGRNGMAKRDSKIATVAIGYADGFSRAFGNGKISLLVNGKAAPVIGNVCMDMTMLDVTGINVREGDEVIVFGEHPTIMELAGAIGTIPYEILTNISSRVTRVFYSG
jgi:alanine racemase